MLPSKVWQALRNERDTVSTAAPRPDLANLERAALESALDASGHKATGVRYLDIAAGNVEREVRRIRLAYRKGVIGYRKE